MSIRSLTDDEKAELEQMNQAIEEAIKKRTAWLDAKMVECSSIKVGDELYELNSGHRVGVVSKLYRYHAGHAEFDCSHYCSYEYQTSGNCYDNTSRQYISFGSADELMARRKSELEYLEYQIRSGSA